MSTGSTHEEWFCCRPYLLSVLNMQDIPISMDTGHFLDEGTRNQVMRELDGHPPYHLTPSSVIAIERDYRAPQSMATTTRYYYFAFDEEVGAWFELGDERWLALRSQMRKDSSIQTTCRQHDTTHWFETYKQHTDSGTNSPVLSPVHTSLSRKDRRKKGNGRCQGNGKGNEIVGKVVG